MNQQESGRRYEMLSDKLPQLGAFALGAMTETAARNHSPEVREFAQRQLDLWVQHGLIAVAS
jgi:hypothetical protein